MTLARGFFQSVSYGVIFCCIPNTRFYLGVQTIVKTVVAPHETKSNGSLRGNQDKANYTQTLDAKSTQKFLVQN